MKLRGAWRRDYSEFFDTQEALLIDAMDNADSIYTVFARLQSLAVKCGCAGKLLLHESVPYTDEMLAAVTKKTVPAFRQCVQPLVQLGLVICEDGIYAIADWEFNQNAPAIDAMREGNRSRKAKERARKSGGKSASEKKREKLVAFLAAHPSATKTEMSKATGLSRVTINKYLSELPTMLPAPAIPEESGVQKAEGNVQGVQSVQNVQMYTVQNGVQMEEVRSHFAEMGFAVDPDRFFDVNEGRGWRTNSGKPVDDWKKLAAVWDRNEHPKAATPLARTEPKANAVGKIPSVEEVMAKWGCDRETAQGYIDENMY